MARVYAALATVYLVWGSTYLGIRIAVESIPPFSMAAIRFFIAGAVLLGWSIAREGRDFRWPSRREWRDTVIVGALLLGGGMGLCPSAEPTARTALGRPISAAIQP